MTLIDEMKDRRTAAVDRIRRIRRDFRSVGLTPDPDLMLQEVRELQSNNPKPTIGYFYTKALSVAKGLKGEYPYLMSIDAHDGLFDNLEAAERYAAELFRCYVYLLSRKP